MENKLTETIIGSAIEVHRHLGPGLLESAYKECLLFELRSKGLIVEKEKPLPIIYKEIKLDHGLGIVFRIFLNNAFRLLHRVSQSFHRVSLRVYKSF